MQKVVAERILDLNDMQVASPDEASRLEEKAFENLERTSEKAGWDHAGYDHFIEGKAFPL